ncbi:FAD-binding protein [Gymnodinialimonas sp. 2305UL16-5]|uniref:FAD-binding protein n=1 Tax=Gymnodinialimonas mytili TaxID=3126503 RepID=UPI00309C496D
MSPATEAELSAAIAEAKGALKIVGGGTRAVGAVDGAAQVVSTAAMTGVELYDPGALTLVVRAGTPLAEVQALLATEGQMLPFEPVDLSMLMGRTGASTIGGVVAANASGPRRVQAGACRDALIGVRFVDGSGIVVKNGGRVMKNVTGYDLVKLMAGSWGTLGVLSEVAFKVLPKLNGATLAVRGVDPDVALAAMTRAIGSPYDVTGAASVPGEAAFLRVEGLETSVAYRVGQLKDLLGDLGDVDVLDDPEASAQLWRRIGEVRDFADGSTAIWRVSMKPSDLVEHLLPDAVLDGAEYRLDWAGGLAWIRVNAADGVVERQRALQAKVARLGGHATLFKAPAEVLAQVSAFQPEANGVAALSRGLRQKFDPRGILNSGLMGA